MDTRDLNDLAEAKRLLESPGFLIKLTNQVGRPIEWTYSKLPATVSRKVGHATRAAIEKGLSVAVMTLSPRGSASASDGLHRGLVAATGAAGGFFGLAALAAELPASTVLMLRSIAEHAREQGEDLGSVETRLQCLSVLALGGRARSDDAADSGYFATRIALARAITQAAEYVAEKGIADVAASRGAPVIARLIAALTERFGIVVSEKAVAQAAPLLGAIGGASINLVFMSHFQDVARGHFTVRRLERKHGADAVRLAYDALPAPR